MKDSLFVTCARGLEDILAQELKQILHSHPIVDKGGVHVHGKLKELYQINLHTRIGMHVLKPILELKSNFKELILLDSLKLDIKKIKIEKNKNCKICG